MTKNLVILGSTGSIGKQTLEVVKHLPDIKICALTARDNIEELENQIHLYHPSVVCVTNHEKAEELRKRVHSCDVLAGEEGLKTVAAWPEADTVLHALVGSAGLPPALAAIEAKKTLALANKETLVAAGELVMSRANETGALVLPVDSEHSAIFQCLRGNGENSGGYANPIHRLYLTASGGPFRSTPKESLKTVTAADALKHPNWSMGAKITIDSATMMNKGLEIIEAHRLFDVPQERIQVFVHPQSIIHSMVAFEDGAVLAQLGLPDMRQPIQYALTFPKRSGNPFAKIDMLKIQALTFEPPDEEKFPCLALARDALAKGGVYPAILNGANEIAVAAFLAGKVSFTQIPVIIENVMRSYTSNDTLTLPNVLKADAWARSCAASIIKAGEICPLS